MTDEQKAVEQVATPREHETLGTAFPREQQRVRELIPLYKAIGPAGAFGLAMIKRALSNAERAAISGDILAIMQAYEELRSFKE